MIFLEKDLLFLANGSIVSPGFVHSLIVLNLFLHSRINLDLGPRWWGKDEKHCTYYVNLQWRCSFRED